LQNLPKIAQKKCAKLRFIFEIPRNEDYVVGSRELQSLPSEKSGTANNLVSNTANTASTMAKPSPLETAPELLPAS
jgi:hypothetical protein